MLQVKGEEAEAEAAPMEVSAPSTSGAATDSPAPAADGSAEAATPGTEGTAKKMKKDKKVYMQKQHCCCRLDCCLHGLCLSLHRCQLSQLCFFTLPRIQNGPF